MKKNKKRTKNNQSDTAIPWIDKILLDPKQFKKFQQYIAGVIIVIIAGFVILQIANKNNDAPYYWPIMGILIALVIIVIIISFVFAFLKGSRFKKFNKHNFEDKLFRNYASNQDVKQFKIINNDEVVNNIPAETLICSRIPQSFKFFHKSNNFQLTFNNSPTILEYVLALYKSSRHSALSTLEGNIRKVLVIKLKSINQKTFYITNQTINFTNGNYVDVNSQRLVLKGKTNNYYIFANENDELNLKEMLDIKVLDKFLFNPNYLTQAYDLYNDKDSAYLITTVPMMFMNANLEANESIKQFEQNLMKQAENDLIILKLLSNLKRIIEEDLVKHVDDLKNQTELKASQINEPEIKTKESKVDPKD